jgi:23S rRNA (guanine745-N1)-methyltransferase
VPQIPLSCTVRGCGRPLRRERHAWSCSAGHSFDIARNGYVNLLQPADRRSPAPGDSTAAVTARERLLGANVGRSIFDAFVERIVPLCRGKRPLVVDLGSGSGATLAAIASRTPVVAIGIDLSAAAADRAARLHPLITWVVANADRRLPLLDHSTDVVLSQYGRRNPIECSRILKRDGHLVLSVPAADDLVELREEVQGQRTARQRAETVLREHVDRFALVGQTSARERRTCGREVLLDLLHGTYRGARPSALPRVEALESLEVTLASEILVLAPR